MTNEIEQAETKIDRIAEALCTAYGLRWEALFQHHRFMYTNIARGLLRAYEVTPIAEHAALVRRAALSDARERERLALVQQRTEAAAAAQDLGKKWDELFDHLAHVDQPKTRGAWDFIDMLRIAIEKIVDPPAVEPYNVIWYDGVGNVDDIDDEEDFLFPDELAAVEQLGRWLFEQSSKPVDTPWVVEGAVWENAGSTCRLTYMDRARQYLKLPPIASRIDDGSDMPPCERCSDPCAPKFCPLGGKWREADGQEEPDGEE